MKVLFVCHRFPYPPIRGGKIRPFNIIKHLHTQGHEVHVASLTRSAAETEAISGIEDHCSGFFFAQVNTLSAWARMLVRLPTLIPSSLGYFYSGELAAHIKQITAEKEFDCIFVHCSSVAQYVVDIDRPKVIDFGDMDSQKWLIYAKTRRFPMTLGYWWEGIRMAREEKRLASLFDLSTCTTRAELDTLQEYGSAQATDWFPNGVDLDFFQPSQEPYDPDMLCFVGRMDYYPNQEAMITFCHQVLPKLQALRPATKLQIVGADPSRQIEKLGQLPGVSVTGSVADVRPYVQNSAATIAPLAIARGTQNKILESMAMGVPVISSTAAARGVDARPGEDIVVADTVDEYCQVVPDILDNRQARENLSIAARQRVCQKHHWNASTSHCENLLTDLAKNKSGR